MPLSLRCRMRAINKLVARPTIVRRRRRRVTDRTATEVDQDERTIVNHLDKKVRVDRAVSLFLILIENRMLEIVYMMIAVVELLRPRPVGSQPEMTLQGRGQTKATLGRQIEGLGTTGILRGNHVIGAMAPTDPSQRQWNNRGFPRSPRGWSADTDRRGQGGSWNRPPGQGQYAAQPGKHHPVQNQNQGQDRPPPPPSNEPRKNTGFYRATMRSIYARYCCRDSVCPSVCPSICQTRVL